MTHDTKATMDSFKHVANALKMLTNERTGGYLLETSEADYHDSLRDDGMPTASVVLEKMLEIYPYTTSEKVGIAQREQTVQKWAIDKFVDDSDPSVGMWGDTPVQHSDHATLHEAIIEAGKMLFEHCIRESMRREYTL